MTAAADPAALIELAVRAKTRIKRRGRWAATMVSVNEMMAMAAVLDAVFEDHPDGAGRAAGGARPPAAPRP